MPIHGYPGNIITANPTAPTVSAASGVWTTEQQLQAVSQGNWPGYEYPISRSLRFNSADSANLTRTPASTTNRQIWTWSAWVKRAGTSSNSIFSTNSSDNLSYNYFGFSSDSFRLYQWNGSSYDFQLITTPVYRDYSAWYHFVVRVDTTQATAANRVRFYVNNVEVTAFSTNTTPSQNLNTYVNNSSYSHLLGRNPGGSSSYFDGYMTEINFIDGQALTPSSFGLNDPETGIWSPKQYTGTYGTNGFYLNFSDNSGTTSTTLGKDYSGNGNNWTPNNFSVTAGAGNDSLVDTPTSYGTDTGVGGEVRGNYATLNPLSTGVTLSNGNLDLTNGASNKSSYSTIGVSSGKWYFEAVYTNVGSTTAIGVALLGYADPTTYVGGTLYSYSYDKTGSKYNNNSGSAYGASYTNNDVIGIALDIDGGTLTFYKNNVSQGTAFTGLPAGTYFLGASSYSATGSANFGQRPFAYTAPSGFKALCTQNLPTPTIGATSTTTANKYFDATTYTGTGSSQSITNSGSMQPDFVWIKSRSAATSNGLFDAVRGTNKALYSNLTAAEDTYTNTLNSFNSNGFSLGNDSTWGGVNTNTATYVGWQWNAGGSNATNTSGTITSTVRANTTAGFSIVTFTGNNAAATVGHGLGVAPSMVIVKRRDGVSDWSTWHTGLSGGTYYVSLNSTAAQATNSIVFGAAPTSTVVSIGTSLSVNNATYVMYCFSAVAGYSAFGSYTGNGSTDGPFVYTGFRPRWVMFKKTSATSNWSILDTSRDDFNVSDNPLLPNTSGAESTSTSTSGAFADILSNGFKLRGNSGDINDSGATYIYAAFAESPFKYALAR